MTEEIVIFDIDGTLADVSERIHHLKKKPKDWKSFFGGMAQDKAIRSMVRLCNLLYDSGIRIILCSGRSEEHRDETVTWLAEQGVKYHTLLLRKDRDHRTDSVVKREMLADIDKEKILFVVEDRRGGWLGDVALRGTGLFAMRARGILSMDTSVFTQPVSNLYQWNDVIVRNLAYIKKELPALSLPIEIREEISTVCNDFEWTLSDVRKEIRNLEDKLGMHSEEEPFDPNIVNPDPHVTIGFIQRRMLDELPTLHEVVQKLGKLAEQDRQTYGLVSLLVSESATNILKAYLSTREDLKFIEEHLKE